MNDFNWILIAVGIVTGVFSLLIALILMSRGGCPDCGWLFACESCSEKFAALDDKLDKEGQE